MFTNVSADLDGRWKIVAYTIWRLQLKRNATDAVAKIERDVVYICVDTPPPLQGTPGPAERACDDGR